MQCPMRMAQCKQAPIKVQQALNNPQWACKRTSLEKRGSICHDFHKRGLLFVLIVGRNTLPIIIIAL